MANGYSHFGINQANRSDFEKKKMNCIQVFRDRLKDFILSSTHKLLYACNCSSTKIVKDAQTLKDFESLRSTGTYRFIVDF